MENYSDSFFISLVQRLNAVDNRIGAFRRSMQKADLTGYSVQVTGGRLNLTSEFCQDYTNYNTEQLRRAIGNIFFPNQPQQAETLAVDTTQNNADLIAQNQPIKKKNSSYIVFIFLAILTILFIIYRFIM